MRIAYPKQIREAEDDLAKLEKELRAQPTAVRVQMLRLLKSGTLSSVARCAPLLGYSVTQLHRWWATYRAGGLDALLQRRTPPGKPSRLTAEARAGVPTEIRAGRSAQFAAAQRYLNPQRGTEHRSMTGTWLRFKR